jgi:4-diphosphocytidyl-2-C-methyl-D-erythritol kinase
VASGVGGGSADAASTLSALNRLWGLGWSPARLAALGATLGGDVAVFFAGGGGAFMSGVGESCAPMALPPLAAVLVNPSRPLPTADVYRQFDRMHLGSSLGGEAPPRWDSAEAAIAAMRAAGNDLEAPARQLMPQISDILAELRADPAVRYAAMSGSGATMFALTLDWSAAETLADALIARHGDWWIMEAMLGA